MQLSFYRTMAMKNKQKCRLDLYRYIGQICRFYSLSQQAKVYESILAESKTLARHFCVYQAVSGLNLGYLVLALYGFRTAAQHNVHGPIPGDLVAFAAEFSQYKSIDYVVKLSGGLMKPTWVLREESRLARLLTMLRLAGALFKKNHRRKFKKILRIIRHVDRRQGWVQALNISSFLFNVFAFGMVLTDENKVAFTANDFSPVPLAFKYAGQKAGLKQMLTMHGQISSSISGNLFPRLDYDIAYLYGKASLQAYEAAGKPKGRVVFTGFPGESLPLRAVPETIGRIGVCLANYYDSDTGKALEAIARQHPAAQILIRWHPRMSQRPLFEEGNIAYATNGDIKNFSQACDLVIAGNTGAQIDLLKLGCPVLHFPALDKLGNDDIGLVAADTVPLYAGKKIVAAEINKFFDAAWVEKFRVFDALYMASAAAEQNVHKEVQQAYMALI